MSHSCPCCSGISYALCCQPFHKGVLPDNALQLMRSRYAAYALGLSSYIIATTHPASPYYCTDHAKWMQKISESYAEVDFEGLEILDWTEETQTATVTFTARLSRNKQDLTFTEKSLFEKVEGLWLYLSGQIL